MTAKKTAKLTGKLVAIALVLGKPFATQSVSLIGFSLGTEVVKSCLKTLYNLGANDLVLNVTFLGGATYICSNKLDLWSNILSTTVNGNIKNAYTCKDVILLLYTMTTSY